VIYKSSLCTMGCKNMLSRRYKFLLVHWILRIFCYPIYLEYLYTWIKLVGFEPALVNSIFLFEVDSLLIKGPSPCYHAYMSISFAL